MCRAQLMLSGSTQDRADPVVASSVRPSACCCTWQGGRCGLGVHSVRSGHVGRNGCVVDSDVHLNSP